MRSKLVDSDWRWTRHLAVMAAAVFALNVAIGLSDSVRTNFFVDLLGMSGEQILWLEGLREIPGLALVFIAAAMMAMPPRIRATAALLTMAVGYAFYLAVPSFAVLVPVEILASLGLHIWMPLLTLLGTALAARAHAGRVLGLLGGAAALGMITGMGLAALLSGVGEGVPLRAYYAIGAVLIAAAGLLLTRLPRDTGVTVERPQRILVSKRYWLFYLLTFMQGARKQVMASFGALVLVAYFDWQVWQISTLLLVSAVVNTVASPAAGWALDRFGERTMLATSYVITAFCCVGFAVVRDIWALIVLFVAIKALITLNIGVDSWVSRTIPRQELAPTLAAGLSFNHISSLAMPLLNGLLLPLIQYEGVYLLTAGLTLATVPFALMMNRRGAEEPERVVAAPAVGG